uniref:Uncharacterized protein n=1 Tax=Anguilla anguilla TaxID=7936 RepID=A0A0E9VW07_ANGAN
MADHTLLFYLLHLSAFTN